jgi:hypothetical protein
MSYRAAEAVQAAVFRRLSEDPGVQALAGTAVYDRVPPGPRPATWLSLGAEEARARRDAGGAVAEHDLSVSVETEAEGFAVAKRLAAAAEAALAGLSLPAEAGRLLDLRLVRARARRAGPGDRRRIDLVFRAVVDLGSEGE